MWDGYLDSKKPAFNESLYNFLKPYKIEYMHTSGHADLGTLKTVFETVKPKCGIIPIHTEAPEKFQELFHEQATIIPLHDGDVFDVK
jgi:ribonuclease J